MEHDYKLQLKIGPNEFFAEGPLDIVKRDFDLWKAMIGELPVAPPASVDEKSKQLLLGSGDNAPPLREHADRLYSYDEKQAIVTLRILPRSEDRNAEALVLLLLGFRTFMNMDEVPVTLLRSALRQSGCTVDRVDQVAGRFVRKGFVNKGGRAKGGRYSLTNSGLEKARTLLTALLTS
jgi:hypothetical protein